MTLLPQKIGIIRDSCPADSGNQCHNVSRFPPLPDKICFINIKAGFFPNGGKTLISDTDIAYEAPSFLYDLAGLFFYIPIMSLPRMEGSHHVEMRERLGGYCSLSIS